MPSQPYDWYPPNISPTLQSFTWAGVHCKKETIHVWVTPKLHPPPVRVASEAIVSGIQAQVSFMGGIVRL